MKVLRITVNATAAVGGALSVVLVIDPRAFLLLQVLPEWGQVAVLFFIGVFAAVSVVRCVRIVISVVLEEE